MQNFLKVTIIVTFVIGVILMISLLAASFKGVDTSEVAFTYDATLLELDDSKIYMPGRYFIGVSHYFITFRTDVQVLNFNQT
jgi:hypothetical protein